MVAHGKLGNKISNEPFPECRVGFPLMQRQGSGRSSVRFRYGESEHEHCYSAQASLALLRVVRPVTRVEIHFMEFCVPYLQQVGELRCRMACDSVVQDRGRLRCTRTRARRLSDWWPTRTEGNDFLVGAGVAGARHTIQLPVHFVVHPSCPGSKGGFHRHSKLTDLRPYSA